MTVGYPAVLHWMRPRRTREAVTGYLEAAAINSLPVPAEHELDIVEIEVAAP